MKSQFPFPPRNQKRNPVAPTIHFTRTPIMLKMPVDGLFTRTENVAVESRDISWSLSCPITKSVKHTEIWQMSLLPSINIKYKQKRASKIQIQINIHVSQVPICRSSQYTNFTGYHCVLILKMIFFLKYKSRKWLAYDRIFFPPKLSKVRKVSFTL